MSQILSQEEVDALLRGISGGEVETESDTSPEISGLKTYDLTSQDRIVRGRMPVLELINDRFSRLMRGSLTASLRKPVGSSIISTDMMKYGEFLKTLPVPTSLHIVKMEPLRGNVLIVLESKLVFCLIDIFFGGTGEETFKVEGREFTGIENRLVKRVVSSMLIDLKEAWKSILPVSLNFIRSEVNPQFVTIVPADDIVVVINFELEMEHSTGKVTLCFPYSSLEPIKDKLQGGAQGDQLEKDSAWVARLRKQLGEVPLEVVAELGKAFITGRELLTLSVGDVITLETSSKESLAVKVEGVDKFRGYPGCYRGSQALQISSTIERRY